MSSRAKFIFILLVVTTLGATLSAVGQQLRTNPAKKEQAVAKVDDSSRRSPNSSGQQVANVTIEVVGPAGATFGMPMDYELVVRNQGSNAVEKVRVEAELPSGTEFISAAPTGEIDEGTASWSLDRLDAGRERRIKLQLKPTDEGTLECHAMVTCMVLSAVKTVVTRPQLLLTMTGPREVPVGQGATFTLKISNPGTGPATNVIVRDLVPQGFEHPAGDEIEYEVGTLPAGESREVRLELTAKTGGAVTNSAQVTADGDLKQVAESAIRVLEPQLAVRKNGPKRRYLEQRVPYSIVVTNPGTFVASKISVVDEVPEGLVLVEASDAGRLSQDKRSLRWNIDRLEAGESRTLTATFKPTSAGEFVSQAVATAEGGLRAESQVSTAIEGICALSLEVVDLIDPIESGSDTTYEIRVVNQGTLAATNVIIQAVAPKGMRPLKGEGPDGVGFEIKGQDIVFEPLPRLAARADAAFLVYAKAEKAGDLRFKVSLHCDQLDSAVNKEESTRVFADE